MALRVNTTRLSLFAAGLIADCGNNAKGKFYTGARPVTPGDAPAGTLLATVTFAAPIGTEWEKASQRHHVPGFQVQGAEDHPGGILDDEIFDLKTLDHFACVIMKFPAGKAPFARVEELTVIPEAARRSPAENAQAGGNPDLRHRDRPLSGNAGPGTRG